MLKAVAMTNTGPMVLIGLCDENIRRMNAGMPLDIDLKELTPPGKRLVRMVVHLAHTYTEVLDDWEAGGIPVNPEMFEMAEELDRVMRENAKD